MGDREDVLMDYSDRCRLCIAGSKRLSIDIFSPEGKRSKLQSKISKYLSLKVNEDDKLPSAICYQCLFRLETWVSFKKHCADSDQTLKNWAFFCGAITPESYLNEANKSPENGSDVEKPTYFSPKNTASSGGQPRTPIQRDNIRHGRGRTSSIDESAPMSSSPSSSPTSRVRGPETSEKRKTHGGRSPLNGMSQQATSRPPKHGRRKTSRPNKAVPTSSNPTPERASSNVTVRLRDIKSSEVAGESDSIPPNLFPLKRKRGRPSKAWLRERAALEKKMKEIAALAAASTPAAVTVKKEISPEKSPPKKSPENKGVTELIELDDPDFGSMKFTLSVVESPDKSNRHRESSTSSSGRMSSDSCSKEEFSGFGNLNPETPDVVPSPREEAGMDDRLSEIQVEVKEERSSSESPQKSDRKRSHSSLSHCSLEESREKIKRLDDGETNRRLPVVADEKIERLEDFVPSQAAESVEEGVLTTASVLAESSAPETKKIEEEEAVSEEESSRVTSSYLKSEEIFKDDSYLEEDSDGDLPGPPMSPLSPARACLDSIEIEEEVIEETVVAQYCSN